MHAEICTAIHKRRLLKFSYGSGTRVVEPYAYGVGDGGYELLRAYQVARDDDPRVIGWKLFHVAEIDDIAVLQDSYEAPRLGYMRNDPTMTKIYCEI